MHTCQRSDWNWWKVKNSRNLHSLRKCHFLLREIHRYKNRFIAIVGKPCIFFHLFWCANFQCYHRGTFTSAILNLWIVFILAVFWYPTTRENVLENLLIGHTIKWTSFQPWDIYKYQIIYEDESHKYSIA